MKKFIRWLDKWLPYAWGTMWISIITVASVAGVVLVTKWLLSLLGVL